MQKQVLLLVKEVGVRERLYDELKKYSYEVRCELAFGENNLEELVKGIDIILVEESLMWGKQVPLWKMFAHHYPAPVVLIVDEETDEIKQKAYEVGVYEVIPRHIAPADFELLFERVLKAHSILDPRANPHKRLLIVDDDPEVRRELVEFFQMKKFEVEEADSGEKALLVMETCSVDAVLLDIKMRGMDGILTLKKMREKHPALGIVMATGLRDKLVAREALSLGAYSYVLKPFDLKYLETVVMTRLAMAA